jgi:type IV secretion system protein VirD4
MQKYSVKQTLITWAALLCGLLWLCGKIAMTITPGVTLENFSDRFAENCINIFRFEATAWTAAFLFGAVVTWLIALAHYLVRTGQYMQGKEHGSARWGDIRQTNAALMSKTDDQNIILSKNIRVDMRTQEIGNVNTLVIGGSGSGKTRFWVKPNLLNLNASYFVVDPAGELLRDLGWVFERNGYEIKVINTIDLKKSNRYNPFRYLQNEQDVYSMVNILMSNTREEESKSQDAFWDEAATLLIQSLMMYLFYEAPEYEQNIPMMMHMLDMLSVKETDTAKKSALDHLFDELTEDEPEHIAVRLYNAFRQKAPGKTALSVLITIEARLNMMYIGAVQDFFNDDELELERFGERKTIIFAQISDAENSFNFIVTMLYSQLFLYTYRRADSVHDGKLPVPVTLVFDEFANCALPKEFTNKLTTCRKRNINMVILLQAVSQLKKIFDDDWETVVGTCGLRVYLGGEEPSTHESMSKQIGRATVKYDTFQKNMRDYTTNMQSTGRDLMTMDEVRSMGRDDCLVFIQYHKPLMDKKYDLSKHKRIVQTADGKAPKYVFDPKTYLERKEGMARLNRMFFPDGGILYLPVNVTIIAPGEVDENYVSQMNRRN